jgi:hypothetical protein
VKLPVSFEQFSKDPVKGLLFLVIVCIGYLYMDIRSTHSDSINMCNDERVKLEIKVDKLVSHVRKSDSALAYSISKIEMLSLINE